MPGPIYLLSSERSGTNLLRKRLGDFQSEICCSIPPVHFLRTFGYSAPILGPFCEDANWMEAIRLFIRCAKERAVPWDIDLSVEDMQRGYADAFGDRRNLILLSHHFYQQYAQAHGYRSYFCKDLWLFDFACDIACDIPEARFIHLARDPRDVCASQMERPFGPQSAYILAHDWKQQCDRSLQRITSSMLQGRSISLTYEAFLADEKACLSAVCQAFALKPEAPPSKQSIATHFHEWKNLDRETMADNAGKYREKLSRRDVRIVEAIAWNTMRKLGYQTSYHARPSIGAMDRVASSIWALYGRGRSWIYRWKLRNEPINRRASQPLVRELEDRFR